MDRLDGCPDGRRSASSRYSARHEAAGYLRRYRLGPVLGRSASATPAHKLKTFEARSAAESAASSFYLRRDLDTYKVGRCKRRNHLRVVCAARVDGETDRVRQTCILRIRVRAVYRGYWDEVASIVRRRCRSEAKEVLTYPVALVSIQTEADRFAGRATAITYMNRRDLTTFNGRAEWDVTDPGGCKGCGYDSETDSFYDTPTTENCSVELVSTLTLGLVSVATEGFACY